MDPALGIPWPAACWMQLPSWPPSAAMALLPSPPRQVPSCRAGHGPSGFPPPRPPDKETSPPPGQGDDPTAGIKAPHTATAPQPAPPCCCWVPCC